MNCNSFRVHEHLLCNDLNNTYCKLPKIRIQFLSVIEMVNKGSLKQKGFIKQEEISFEKFLETDSGKLFLD